ncbi:MAG: hypothetical protein KDC92_14085 [Bacteroidetes bacterium]|nr:hypothetical protein [Bacteroidota bacterium]
MKSIFSFLAVIMLPVFSYAQDYSMTGFQDPGAGDGSDGQLNVPAGTTHIMNSVRARVTNITYHRGMGGNIYYSDLEGTLYTDDLLLMIVNSGTADNPNIQNHWLLRPSNYHDPKTASSGYFLVGHSVPIPANFDDVQIVKVWEFSSASQIDGTITCDAYDDTKKHGGIVAFTVDGTLHFGTTGKVDVTGKGHYGGVGGTGGVAGVNNPAPPMNSAAGYAPGNLDEPGGDAAPADLLVENSYLSIGSTINNLNPNCNGGNATLSSPDGGAGTAKIFGTEGTLGEDGSRNAPSNASYKVFTMGSSGKGGDGGLYGASAGGNGGGGATNCAYGRNTNGNNHDPGAGDGERGYDPTHNGGSHANGGYGGQGGKAGGAIWIRAQDVICDGFTNHFISKGLSGANGESVKGKGGTGGYNGKGADGYCSSLAAGSNIICPAGGNGGIGIGGNGADAGSGGSAGTHGCIWIGYLGTSTTTNITQNNIYFENGVGGFGGLAGKSGDNGMANQATFLDLTECECGGDFGTKTVEKSLDCMCEENFTRLANYAPNGTTPDGYPLWELAAPNPENRHCYYDTDANQLICYQEITHAGGPGQPTVIEKRTTMCGEFACTWTDFWFTNAHQNWSNFIPASATEHEVGFAEGSVFTFRTRKFNDGPDVCEPTCDASDEKKGKAMDNPKDGKPGQPGETYVPASTGDIYQYPSSSPFPS